MATELGPVGVALSVVFALFMIVLFTEIYYVWWIRRRRRLDQGNVTRCTASSRTKAAWRWACVLVLRALELCRWSVCREALVARWKFRSRPKNMCSDSWTRLLSWRKRAEDAEKEWSGTLEEEGKAGKQDDDTEEVSEGEDDEEEDLLKIAGFWGPHRLLFTIMEEPDEEKKAVEELEQQQPQACKGRGSRAGSRASSELLFVDTSSSCSTSPFVTPSSSPPFATPLGSPASPWVPLSANAYLPCKPVEVDSTSSSSTSSSSPRLLGRTPLSRCREGNSSLSPSLSSSSLSSTPAVGSPCGLTLPPPFVSSPCCKQHPRHPLGLLLDPLPLPNSGPHCDNRVYPLTVECSNDIHTAFSDCSSCKSSGPPSTPQAFHIPPPSQPTTPRPFRASLHLKRAASAFPSPSHSNVVAHLSS